MTSLIKTEVVYRTDTVEEALKLRESLSNMKNVELKTFSYESRVAKEKGEIVDEWQRVKATIIIDDEKNPEKIADITFNM